MSLLLLLRCRFANNLQNAIVDYIYAYNNTRGAEKARRERKNGGWGMPELVGEIELDWLVIVATAYVDEKAGDTVAVRGLDEGVHVLVCAGRVGCPCLLVDITFTLVLLAWLQLSCLRSLAYPFHQVLQFLIYFFFSFFN